jgi:hypothetical protein
VYTKINFGTRREHSALPIGKPTSSLMEMIVVHYNNHTKVSIEWAKLKKLVLNLAMRKLSIVIQSLTYVSSLNLQWILHSCIHISSNRQVIYIYIYIYNTRLFEEIGWDWIEIMLFTTVLVMDSGKHYNELCHIIF